MAEAMAVTPDGIIKSVSAFSAAEKWWCDGEECGSQYDYPHVHCMMHSHPVDLETGRSVDVETARAKARARRA
jgi:hypothetical protein